MHGAKQSILIPVSPSENFILKFDKFNAVDRCFNANESFQNKTSKVEKTLSPPPMCCDATIMTRDTWKEYQIFSHSPGHNCNGTTHWRKTIIHKSSTPIVVTFAEAESQTNVRSSEKTCNYLFIKLKSTMVRYERKPKPKSAWRLNRAGIDD